MPSQGDAESLRALRDAERSRIVTLLGAYRYRFQSERDLQDGLEQVLVAAGVSYQREFVLDASSRPDFLLAGGVVVEVKIAQGARALARQVDRYARHADVTAIIVVTQRRHLGALPRSIDGKPVDIVVLRGGLA